MRGKTTWFATIKKSIKLARRKIKRVTMKYGYGIGSLRFAVWQASSQDQYNLHSMMLPEQILSKLSPSEHSQLWPIKHINSVKSNNNAIWIQYLINGNEHTSVWSSSPTFSIEIASFCMMNRRGTLKSFTSFRHLRWVPFTSGTGLSSIGRTRSISTQE
jgi:hypothetical protein